MDQLEIQLATTDHPPRSAALARLHAQSVKTLEDVTVAPLAEGHALLEITGRGAPGAEVHIYKSRFFFLMLSSIFHTGVTLRLSDISMSGVCICVAYIYMYIRSWRDYASTCLSLLRFCMFDEARDMWALRSSVTAVVFRTSICVEVFLSGI